VKGKAVSALPQSRARSPQIRSVLSPKRQLKPRNTPNTRKRNGLRKGHGSPVGWTPWLHQISVTSCVSCLSWFQVLFPGIFRLILSAFPVSWFASSREYLSKTRRWLQRKGVSATKLGKLPRGCRANSAGATPCSAGRRGVGSTTRLVPTGDLERVSSGRQRGRGFRPPPPRARRRSERFLRARAAHSAAGSGAPAPSRWLWGFAAAGLRPHRVPRPRR